MLTRVKYHLPPGLPLSSRSAPLFHGALMQRIDPAYGEILHRPELKPYSQYLDCGAERPVWVLQTLTADAAERLSPVLGLSAGDALLLEQKDLTVPIEAVERETLTPEALLEQTFFADCPRSVRLRFATPTAFKVQGRYQNYPSIRHLFGSLAQKYDAADSRTEISCEGLLDDLERFVCVTGYHLRSVSYTIKGVAVPSFLGTMQLRVSGPQQLVGLTHLLLRFGTYSGVGIKTAMGMGALQIIERKGPEHA